MLYWRKSSPTWRKKLLFHHDNAPAHTSAIATAKLFYLRYEIFPHPTYSRDLAPSNYFLFPNMNAWLEDKRFSSNEEIIAATNEYFEGFDKNYFLERIKKLEYRYNKCIQLKGDYVEKYIGIFVIKSVLHFKVTDLLNSPRTCKKKGGKTKIFFHTIMYIL